MSFQALKGYPPNEEWPIAEIYEEVKGGVSIPATCASKVPNGDLVTYTRRVKLLGTARSTPSPIRSARQSRPWLTTPLRASSSA